MLGGLYPILKILRADILYRSIKRFLPRKLKKWVRAQSIKYDPTPLVSVRDLQPKYKKACQYLTHQIGAQNIGDYLEFGVCHGTSLNCMFQTLKELKLDHVRLFGFDSFEGLPAIAAIDIENELQPGEFASSLEFTSKRLKENGVDWARTFLIKGWYSDTLTTSLIDKHGIKKASLIMIDCDLYSSAKESLNFCIPLIQDTSIIFFDDWAVDQYIGEKRAFDEFLKENPNFRAEQFDTYKYNSLPCGRIFLITNTS